MWRGSKLWPTRVPRKPSTLDRKEFEDNQLGPLKSLVAGLSVAEPEDDGPVLEVQADEPEDGLVLEVQ